MSGFWTSFAIWWLVMCYFGQLWLDAELEGYTRSLHQPPLVSARSAPIK